MEAKEASNTNEYQLDNKLSSCYVFLEDIHASTSKANMEENTTPRRGSRQRKKPNKYGNFCEYSSPTKKRVEYESSGDDDEDTQFETSILKKSSGWYFERIIF